jgi:aminoglycoside phosphotransferase (APT) family kinase protein
MKTAMQASERERVTASLTLHAPELAGRDVFPLGKGLDNTVFLVDDLVLRASEEHSVVREARLLEIVASSVSVPVPVPRFADEDRGVLAYQLLAGRPLLGRPPFAGLARRLGAFLRELHGIDTASVGDLVPQEDLEPAAWLADLDGPTDLVQALASSVPPPTDQRVLAHADLGAEHLLALEGELTGVIDWSDAAVADPALDFARLYRDFGREFLTDVIDAYGGLDDCADTLERVQFYARCAALEDLAYGRTSGRTEYADAAEASISRLFAADAELRLDR